tara:strand:+ start:3796 stop:4656 length:861 start_codon:yes stop_codon:yes gene_type:complete
MYLKLFFNIKFNKEIKLFKHLPNFLSSKAPKIYNNNCKNINMIKYGHIWKTTSESRNKLLIDWIDNYLNNNKNKYSLLELGSSSGVSVFPALKKKKKIKKYFLTDLQLVYYYKKLLANTLLFSKKKSLIPFMAFNKLLIFYSDNKSFNMIFNFASYLIRFILSLLTLGIKKNYLYLLNNQIIEYQKKYPIIFKEFNILSNWEYSKVDLIIALNLFNNSYFSEISMKKIVSNVYSILNNGGIIIIGDNKKKSKISVFKKIKGKFILTHNNGGQVESHDFFLNFFIKK